jgi:MFS transporter, NRE family, putaive nickel resistance protein
MSLFKLFYGLKNPVFARLYVAQTVSLLGDALTWVGLALVAYELAGQSSGVILAQALTLRVAAFVLLAPFAGSIADRTNRKWLMGLAHLARMGIVGLLPFVSQIWQIYGLMLALNAFTAIFTPTYKATLPLVTGREDCPQAIALSDATYQLLGVLGPGLAGSIAALIGARPIFWLDAVSFLVAALLVVSLPGSLSPEQPPTTQTLRQTWQDLKQGMAPLLSDPALRYGLAMQLVTALAGAQVLVNTVGYVQGVLKLGQVEYGWVMAAFGLGATLASILVGSLSQTIARTTLIGLGSVCITAALVPAGSATLLPLLLLWLMAGMGQSLVNLPTQTLIAVRIPAETQGRVYGAHFAWSHLWWLFAYPLAGWTGSHWHQQTFLISSVIGGLLLGGIQLFGSRPLADANLLKP